MFFRVRHFKLAFARFADNLTVSQKHIMGAFFFSLFGFLGVLLTSMGKSIMQKTGLSPVFLMSVRYVLLFLAVLPAMVATKFSFLRNISNLKVNILKDVLATVAVLLWYKSAVEVPINNAVTIAFLNPIFVIIFDSFLQRRPIALLAMFGMLLSFFGVALVVGFDVSGLSASLVPYALIVTVALMRACAAIVSRKAVNLQGVRDAVYSGVLVNFLIVSIVFAFDYKSVPNYLKLDTLKSVAVITLIFGVYYVVQLMAFKMADLSWLQPFDFLRIIFSVALSYFMLGEALSLMSAIGVVLVICGVAFAIKYGRKVF